MMTAIVNCKNEAVYDTEFVKYFDLQMGATNNLEQNLVGNINLANLCYQSSCL